MSTCPMCKSNYALTEAMKGVVDAAELLVDGAALEIFNREAVAAAGSLLTQRVDRYREVIEQIGKEGEENAVQ